ncbi:hypothetical protein Leryth_011677 [Lithospermum erythrorhizon]|nr:hypothetical protein Leryth_011677 [Lithospermum erythrorhizon]
MARGVSEVAELPIRVHSRRGGSNVIHPVENGSSPVIPYSEIKQFKEHFSWLIPSFVIANVFMFVITMFVNNCPKNSVSCIADFLGRFSFQPMKENPLLGPSSSTLEKMGALDVNKVIHSHQVYRLFTCIWLHGGVFHLLANMLSLLVIGIRLEQEFGFVRIGALYLIAGLGGSLLSSLFIQSNISFSVLVTLLIIIAINLSVGILPHVDNFAHIGGFLSGLLLGFVLLMRPHYGWVTQRYAAVGTQSANGRPKFKTYQWVLCIISFVLLIIWFVSGLVMLFRDVNLNDHCSWCHYMSCVPTSKWSCDNQNLSCFSDQIGNQLTLVCSNNNRTGTYTLANPSTSQIQGLCSQLC